MRSIDLGSIGGRLTHIRGSESQRAYADQIGVPLKTYQTYEQGKREPDLRTLLGIYERGWNLHWVLTGQGEERLSSFSVNELEGSGGVKKPSSQSPRLDEIRLAVQLAEEALNGGKLEPAEYAQLVTLIYDALVNGLPDAQVLAFARPAARGLHNAGKSSETDVDRSGKAAAG